eukprot:gene7674-biopygen15107
MPAIPEFWMSGFYAVGRIVLSVFSGSWGKHFHKLGPAPQPPTPRSPSAPRAFITAEPVRPEMTLQEQLMRAYRTEHKGRVCRAWTRCWAATPAAREQGSTAWCKAPVQ